MPKVSLELEMQNPKNSNLASLETKPKVLSNRRRTCD